MIEENILVIDDEEGMRHVLTVMLEKQGYKVYTAPDGEAGLNLVKEHEFAAIFCDIKMPRMDGTQFLKEVIKLQDDTAAPDSIKELPTIIMMSAYGTIDSAIESMKLGAYDYISKPFKKDEIILTLKKAIERERLKKENEFLRTKMKDEYILNNIIGKSDEMQKLFLSINKVAEHKSTVLIIGESGTGKELIAKAVHENSDRKGKPFVTVNCGAIPENLLESELFGHKKGAFTDATEDKKGLFEEAQSGSIFLDEIGEMPQHVQVKLLRVLQDGEIRRLGDTKPIATDARIIAATLKDLSESAKDGTFRQDLYYRLNVFCIKVPPLRERLEDIPMLIEHYIDHYNYSLNKSIKRLDKEVMKKFLAHPWPGNVRELKNMLESSMIMATGNTITLSDLPKEFLEAELTVDSLMGKNELSIKAASKKFEKELIVRALRDTKGNKTAAAKLLEISHKALLYKLKEYEIDS
jgi:two-component system response regulator AtoC